MATNVPAGTVIGSVALDGSLSEWTDADRIDNVLSVAGYDVYARATGGSLLIALSAPVSIEGGTTVWLNSDQNPATGFQIFGFAGGAEYNIDFGASGVPRLFTADAGETVVSGTTVSYTTSNNRQTVEMAVPLGAIGSPSAVNALVDINDEVFLPSAYQLAQYEIITVPRDPVVGSVTLDGDLSDWTAADQIDNTMSVAGYDVYAKATGDSLVFALVSPVRVGPHTTAWLNTDQDTTTGFQIFGFAGGAEYNINFDIAGTPRLYTGNAGQTPVPGATVSYGANGERTIVEFAVPLAAIGSPDAVNTLWDVNDVTFLPTAFQLAQYEVLTAPPSQVVGSVTLDGSLAEWTAADVIDDTLAVAGYDVYARATGDSLVFALQAPVAIGPHTTAWLNTDQDATTGFQIFGFAGGAEYNIDFDVAGTPRLYTGAAGQTLVPGAMVSYGASADRTIVEFAVPLSAIGSPDAVNTLWDVNDVTFLPTAFQLAQYDVVIVPPPPVVGSVTIDADLSEWTPADQIDATLSLAGYDIYARATGDSLVLALQSPVAIGPDTTAWLNTDNDAATGFQIFGFAGGAEFNIDFDSSGTPHLYTGDAGQTLVSGAEVIHRLSADRTILEMAVPLAAIGSPATVSTLWDINNTVFLPTDFSLTQYAVVTAPPPPVVGPITLDGSLADWTAADQIDESLSVGGYDIYARGVGNSYVFAVQAPVAVGANTTAWLNTDQNATTGFQIFGFAGGAEYNIDFDVTGTPRLYTGDAGETLVPGAVVEHAYSADRTTVEFSVLSSAIGSPDAINTLWDINDTSFLPTSFALAQYPVVNVAAPAPTVGSVTLDGSLAEWTAAEQMDTALGVAGYDIYARVTDDSLVFALDAPTAIGARTTAWLNTDANTATGFQVFGFAAGAELNINFDTSGTPHLYSGGAGETLQLSEVLYGYNADRTTVEFAVSLAALGSPATVQTSWDVNDSVFLPTDYSLMQYAIDTTTGALSPVDLV